MGITQGVRYWSEVDDWTSDPRNDDQRTVKCLPETVHSKLPQHLCRAPGEMVFEIEAIHKRCYIREKPGNAYWWTDGRFAPNDDTTMIVTSGAFEPRSTQAWINVKRIPNGRIMNVSLKKDSISAFAFKDSRMANYPKLDMHPSGKYIGYVGLGSVSIDTLKGDSVYNKHKDLRQCNYKSCAFSPNGKYLAILISVTRCFELLLSKLSSGMTFGDTSIDLSRLVPGFKGSSAYNEHIECKWSADSEHIAICSSIGFMVVLNKDLEIIADMSDILPEGSFPSWSGTFDFDPRYCHDVLAVGTSDRCLVVVNTDTKQITFEHEPLSKDSIDCVVYTPNGSQIAVSYRDLNIYFIDTSLGDVVFHIDIKLSCPGLTPYSPSFPALMRMSFTTKGEQLLTSTCDGKVRLWQLPVNISLFSLCKWALLINVPMSKVRHLPLPNQIKRRILSFPNQS